MSFVREQLRRIDLQLDRFQALSQGIRTEAVQRLSANVGNNGGSVRTATTGQATLTQRNLRRIEQLEKIVKTLSSSASDRELLHPDHLYQLLAEALDDRVVSQAERAQIDQATHVYTEELEWVIIGKLAAQMQAYLQISLLEEITPVMDDIYYWNRVLGSYENSYLYMVQTLPARSWVWAKDIMQDTNTRLQQIREDGIVDGLPNQWRQYYSLVRQSIRDYPFGDFQSQLMSPVNSARLEARRRLRGLHKQKEMCAAAIGVLANEGLVFNIDPDELSAEATIAEDWKGTVASSVELMSATMIHCTYHDKPTNEYEDSVFEIANRETPGTGDVHKVYSRLARLLQDTMPEHRAEYVKHRSSFGRPSQWTRYWLPATALLLSSSTILRILVNRKAEIITWIRELGQTTIDFWTNWVVEPVRKIIGTIRHDEDSEIALMSRESLQGDRASLERMVIDFAIENPNTTGSGSPLTEAQIDVIRDKVREGDLTPVLRAYEHDLKKPFARAVTGNLIRELLIQIQKTKVDVEVAMAGIDSLLKSQELVFGFVGLTPGILVCVAVGRWVSGLTGGRKGRARSNEQGRMIRIIRNTDRVLAAAGTQEIDLGNGLKKRILTYKDHGLILCEVQALQEQSKRVLPGEIYKEFEEDLRDLMDIHLGPVRQKEVVDRLRWAYWKWMK